jgi:ABC-type nitrate/sulfonate/bicarbonate transport system permease component
VGAGKLTVIIGITLYSLLPIVRNTYLGLSEVDPGVKEAARGMGMRKLHRRLKVELPLAFPVVFTGIRIATVNAIGTTCSPRQSAAAAGFVHLQRDSRHEREMDHIRNALAHADGGRFRRVMGMIDEGLNQKFSGPGAGIRGLIRSEKKLRKKGWNK